MISIDRRLATKYQDLHVLAIKVSNVAVERTSAELEAKKAELAAQIRQDYDIQTLKDDERIRSYRDFFWRLGLDPTKIRPASEALIRRVLQGRDIPTINTAVDAYNLASMKHNVAIGSFDLDNFEGPLEIRWSSLGEEFLGIGMEEPKVLGGSEIVISDGDKLVAIYPYRDADSTKVTTGTRTIFSLMCGVPGIGMSVLKEAASTTLENITRYCGGTGEILARESRG
jgi:DNA/RNA-binding domain of Phe-tRNA-synthetase-like protein